MKIYSDRTVLEATRKRISWVFDEFVDVGVNFSGGKDSTLILNLALEEAERRDRLPLPVIWIDQESEWQATADYCKTVMYDPRVRPVWLQVEMAIDNAASEDKMMYSWREGESWMRPKDPIAIHEWDYGVLHIGAMFHPIHRLVFGEGRSALLGGLRAAESPSRLKGLTTWPTYKGVTWAKADDKEREYLTFYPLYDWEIRDVWKAIHDFGYPYNKLYDYMWQYGHNIQNMRVSSLNHEGAVASLSFMAEIEPETWNRVTDRIAGTHVAQHAFSTFKQKTLPWMFDSWREYRDYLLENLIEDPERRKIYQKIHRDTDARYEGAGQLQEELWKEHVHGILLNDYTATKLATFLSSNPPDRQFAGESYKQRMQRFQREAAERAKKAQGVTA